MELKKLIAKIDFFSKNIESLPDEQKVELEAIKKALNNTGNNNYLDDIDNKVRKIVEPYCGLEELERWFPKQKKI